MSSSFPSYLRMLRKEYGLTQAELGVLLGVSQGMIAKYEMLAHQPSRDVVIAAELIFGQSARFTFPALFREVQEEVGIRAAWLDAHLERADEVDIARIRQLLSNINRRSLPPPKL